MKNKKINVGFFGFTECEGCLRRVIEIEEVIFEIFPKINKIDFQIIGEQFSGPFDIVFIEGGISNEEDVEKLKKIREETAVLVALGACACFGGVPGVKKTESKKEIFYETIDIFPKKNNQEIKPINEYVKVDCQIKGCPISKSEFISFFKDLILKKLPKQTRGSVCGKCRENENPCLLSEGKLCLGPITSAGCEIICPSQGRGCTGCRGFRFGVVQDKIIKLSEFEELFDNKIEKNELKQNCKIKQEKKQTTKKENLENIKVKIPNKKFIQPFDKGEIKIEKNKS